MKRGFLFFGSIVMICMLILTACNTAKPAAAIPNTDGTQSATATATAGFTRGGGQNNGTSAPGGTGNTGGTGGNGNAQQPRAARATATSTPTVALPSAMPTSLPPSATPAVFPTSAVGASGQMTLPGQAEQLSFQPNATSITVTANLNTHVIKAYQFQGKAGQILYIGVNGKSNLQVFAPSKAAISNMMVMPGYLSLALSETGAYTIGLDGLGNTVMSVYLPGANANLASAAPVPDKVQPVVLPQMPFTVSVDTKIDPSAPAGYSFQGQAGQTLSLLIYQGNTVPVVIGPDGNTLEPDIDMFTGLWQFSIPESGTHTLVLYGSGLVIVTLKTTSLPSGTPAANPPAGSGARIAIPAGQTSLTFSTYFDATKPQSYVLNVPNGLQLSMEISGNAQISQISGPGNTNLVLNHSQYSSVWSALVSQPGDYTIVLAGSGFAQLTFTVPSNAQPPQ